MDPSLLPPSWSGSGGDMNRHVPQGGTDGDGKGLRAVEHNIGKKKIGRSESSNNWLQKRQLEWP
jgi:hypothetical protein